jgi:hypothetical protein
MRNSIKMILALGLLALVGCGKDSVLGVQSSSVAGSYVLRTINGNDLPFTIQQIGDDKTEVLNETLSLTDAGTFALQGNIRVTEAGVTTTEPYDGDGTFTRNGTALTLTFTSGGREAGTVSNGTLTLSSGGFTLLYRR